MDKKLIEKYLSNSYAQIGLLAFFLVLYILTKNSIFGILFAVSLIVTVALEIWGGTKTHGWKHELKDTAITLGGIIVLWFVLTILLNSSVPINAVVSCSMLPNIERGDLILVQGADPIGYEVELTEKELSSLQAPESIISAGTAGTFVVNGSIYSYCAQHRENICNLFVSNPELFTEKRGPFTFNYGTCTRHNGNVELITPCVVSVDYAGETYYANMSHDTIVYGPPSGDLYSYTGDIIHRLFFKIRSSGRTYYLTKGDNNPTFDIQSFDYSVLLGNRAPSEEDYKGKILLRIPYLGYPKLFISGFVSETINCGTTLEYPVVS